ncbi:unnamed protein product [Ectocarpus fasciculatus]
MRRSSRAKPESLDRSRVTGRPCAPEGGWGNMTRTASRRRQHARETTRRRVALYRQGGEVGRTPTAEGGRTVAQRGVEAAVPSDRGRATATVDATAVGATGTTAVVQARAEAVAAVIGGTVPGTTHGRLYDRSLGTTPVATTTTKGATGGDTQLLRTPGRAPDHVTRGTTASSGTVTIARTNGNPPPIARAPVAIRPPTAATRGTAVSNLESVSLAA